MEVKEFTSCIWDIVEDLNNWKASRLEEGRPFFISEFQDKAGHQYINLVQEGGGMLGIGLAGFTYVLEKAGIRFLGLAGTSAGSINSFLLSAIGTPDQEKSERILRHLINKDFMEFIDGGKDAKALIELISYKGKKGLASILAKPLVLWNYMDLKNRQGMNPGLTFEHWLDETLLWESIYDQLSVRYFSNENETIERSVLIQFWNVYVPQLHVFKGRDYVNRFKEFEDSEKDRLAAKTIDKQSAKESNYSLFEATRVMYDAILEIQQALRVKMVALTLSELQQQFKNHEKLLTRIDYHRSLQTADANAQNRPEDYNDPVHKRSFLALIGADITTQTKVIFPEMADHYYEDLDKVNPSELVRASMSVPLLFEPLRISMKWMNPTNTNYESVRRKWLDWSRFRGEIPEEVLIVDGGIMSNFPLDVFEELENKWREQEEKVKKEEAKKTGANYKRGYGGDFNHTTTIGVKLGIDRLKANTNNSFTGIISQCFNNARAIRDFESIYNNPLVSNESIAYIDTENFSWLDFKMSQEDMKALFRAGAQAAADFIKGFNYKQYNSSRNRKSSNITRDKLLTDVFYSKYSKKLYKFEIDRLNRKKIKQKDINSLFNALDLPKNLYNYWADPAAPDKIFYRLQDNPEQIISKDVDHKLYQLTNAYQEVSKGIEDKYKQQIWDDVRNVLLRISLVRNVYNLSRNATINYFPVLWVVESINFEDHDVNDTLLKNIIDYGGGSITTINHLEEAVHFSKNLSAYRLVIIKAYDKDLANAQCHLVKGLGIDSNREVDVIAYINDTAHDKIPNTHIPIYHDPMNLLHRTMDNFHRNIPWN